MGDLYHFRDSIDSLERLVKNSGSAIKWMLLGGTFLTPVFLCGLGWPCVCCGTGVGFRLIILSWLPSC